MPVVRLTEMTTSKLKRLAVPLEDNFDSVISRLADAALDQKVFLLPTIGPPYVYTEIGERPSGAQVLNKNDLEVPMIPEHVNNRRRNQTMDEGELYALLGKIGKGVFVQYFRYFGDDRISNQDVIAMLPNEYTFKSRTSRTSKSRRIFREGLERDALAMIANSNRIDANLSDQAKKLLDELPPAE